MSRTNFIMCESGSRMHIVEEGSGDPCLLIHGLGDGAYIWEPVLADCARGRWAIAVDLLGHGDSDPSATGEYSISSHAQNVGRLVAHLGVRRYVLVGHSLGAAVAAYYASQNLSQVKAVALLDYSPEPTIVGISRVVQDLRRTTLDFETIDDYAQQLCETQPLLQKSIAYTLASGALRRRLDGRFERKFDLRIVRSMPFTPEAAAQAWAALACLNVPVLLMRGEASAVLTRGLADRILGVLPLGSLVTIPAAGHALIGDNPKAVGHALAAFLRDANKLSGA